MFIHFIYLFFKTLCQIMIIIWLLLIYQNLKENWEDNEVSLLEINLDNFDDIDEVTQEMYLRKIIFLLLIQSD